MNTYLMLKWLHIISATVLFGTGIGIAFFKWITDRSGDISAIRIINEYTVLADWIFTTPAVIIQPLTGFGLIYLGGYAMDANWIMLAILLYLVAGACWLPVLKLQMTMRDLARNADSGHTPLPAAYWKCVKIWFWLGVPAFCALIAVYWLMVFKPDL
jgi:uncharacterized membrane protein